MAEQTVDTVRQVVADTFGIDLDDVTMETSPETVEAWESMSHLNLVMSLESRFGVSFDPDDIPELVTVDAIVAKIDSLGS
ncbi:MAG: acyl carrier protein [Phycisphaerae bacterium]|nr:acyl carrier protein [Phycisphaerae bacterium]